MTASTFNALAAARNLKAAGIEAEHAEAIAEEMREAADAAASADLADSATKADLADLEARLMSTLATKTELYREIGALRSEMRWMFAFQGALILAIAAKLFGFV